MTSFPMDFDTITFKDLQNQYLWPHILCADGDFSFKTYNEFSQEDIDVFTDVDGIMFVSVPGNIDFVRISAPVQIIKGPKATYTSINKLKGIKFAYPEINETVLMRALFFVNNAEVSVVFSSEDYPQNVDSLFNAFFECVVKTLRRLDPNCVTRRTNANPNPSYVKLYPDDWFEFAENLARELGQIPYDSALHDTDIFGALSVELEP